MNQAQIASHVIKCLAASAGHDPLAWYPVTGWVRNGKPVGLAAELFGATSSSRQLDQLARVLFRLGVATGIDVAEFRLRHGQTARSLTISSALLATEGSTTRKSLSAPASPRPCEPKGSLSTDVARHTGRSLRH